MNSILLEKNYCSNKFDNYLILLVLSVGMGDIASPLLFSRILALLFLPSLFKRVKFCSYLANLKAFFIFLTIWSAFSLAWSFNFTEGCKGLVYNCIHFAIFFEIVVFSRYACNPLSSISTGWMLAVFCLSVLAMWEIFTGEHLPLAYEETQTINMGGIISQRIIANATFTNYNAFVKFLCYSLPWIFYRISITAKGVLNVLMPILTIILTILIILVDGSRGGLFTIIVMVGVYIFYMPKGKASFITTLLFIGALIFILLEYGETIFLVLSMKSESQGLASDSSRFEIWISGLKSLFNSFGMGSGIGGVSGAIESISINIINAPHNMILEALIEYGVICGMIFIGFIFKCLKKGYRLLDRNRKMVVLMSILSLPIYGIINSLYLKSPDTFVLFATIFVFVNYERIKPFYK